MRLQRSAGLSVTAITLVATFLPRPADASELEEKLRAEYQNKVLTLQHFYEGAKLRFDPDGRIEGDAITGPWTIDGQITIKEIHLEDRLLQLKGQRVRLVFDPRTNHMKDVVGMAAKDPLRKTFFHFSGKRRREFEQSAETEVDLELASPPKDEKEVVAAMNAVFLTPENDLADFLPEYWKHFVLKEEGKSLVLKADNSVCKVEKGVSPPRPISEPDPQYSEMARHAGFRGTLVLWTVVTAEGRTRDVTVVKPLGLGLDEEAVHAVTSWTFTPSQKDGSAVAVQINVEVTFRLY
jgi:protein TonB